MSYIAVLNKGKNRKGMTGMPEKAMLFKEQYITAQ